MSRQTLNTSFPARQGAGSESRGADHFCTENVIVPVLVEKLSKKFGRDVQVSASMIHQQTARFFVPGEN
jgi:hypothetical protein